MAGKTPNLWHSKLVQHCQNAEGPIALTIKTEPTKSKFRGNPMFVIMTIEGVDHAYSCENTRIERDLGGYRGQEVLLEAGGREDDAWIEITDPATGKKITGPPETASAKPERPQQAPEEDRPTPSVPPEYEEEAPAPRGRAAAAPQAQPARTLPKPAPEPSQKPGPLKVAGDRTAQNANGARICMRAVDAIVEARASAGMVCTVDQQQGLVAMLFIEGCKDGLWRSLPVEPIDAVSPRKK
jgi:hypothetical protein